MEVLTDEGWKRVAEVRGDEQVLQLDRDIATWGPILNVVETPFRGYINEHDSPNARISFAVTDDHRFVAGPMHYGKPTHVQCPFCNHSIGAKGIARHEARHEGNGDARIRDERLPVGEFTRRWSLVEYRDLPQEFFVRRTNEWVGFNPAQIVFEAPTVEAVLCAGCGKRLATVTQKMREQARDGRGAYHRARRTKAAQAWVTCSACGSGFPVPRSQARRAKSLYCPGGDCRIGSSPLTDPVSLVTIAEVGVTVLRVPNKLHRRYEFDFKDWAEFLGWFVSEGSTTAVGGSWSINIAQEKRLGAKWQSIRSLLDRMGIPATASDHGFSFHSVTIGVWLREHCGVGSHNKRVPKVIREATPGVMGTFLDAYRLGDGSRHTHPDSARYITSSKALADDLNEMLVKLGRARKVRPMHAEGSVGVNSEGRNFVRRAQTWMVTEAGRPSDSNISKKNVKRTWYEGPSYGLLTPTQTFVVRRRGTTYWSGDGMHLP